MSDAQRELYAPSDQAARSLQQPMRHKSIIAHHGSGATRTTPTQVKGACYYSWTASLRPVGVPCVGKLDVKIGIDWKPAPSVE